MKKLIVILIFILLIELAIVIVRSPRRDGAPRNVVEKIAVVPMVKAL